MKRIHPPPGSVCTRPPPPLRACLFPLENRTRRERQAAAAAASAEAAAGEAAGGCAKTGPARCGPLTRSLRVTNGPYTCSESLAPSHQLFIYVRRVTRQLLIYVLRVTRSESPTFNIRTQSHSLQVTDCSYTYARVTRSESATVNTRTLSHSLRVTNC